MIPHLRHYLGVLDEHVVKEMVHKSHVQNVVVSWQNVWRLDLVRAGNESSCKRRTFYMYFLRNRKRSLLGILLVCMYLCRRGTRS